MAEEEIDPICPPLSQRKSALRSFPTIESYSQDVLERQSRSTLAEGSINTLHAGGTPRSRLGLPVAARIVGRLSLIHKFVRASRAAEVIATIPVPLDEASMSISGGNENKTRNAGGKSGNGNLLPEASLANGKMAPRSSGVGRTAQFSVAAPPGESKDPLSVQRRPNDTLEVPDANLSRSSMSSSRTGLRPPQMGRRDSFDLHMRHIPGAAEKFHPGIRGDFDSCNGPRGSFEGRVYQIPNYNVNGSSAAGFYGEEDAYFDYRNNSDGYYYSSKYKYDPPMSYERASRAPSRHSSRQSDQDGVRGAGLSQSRTPNTHPQSYQQQHQQPKQVRFQEYREYPLLNSDSSFSDGDEGVEHLYQAPSLASRGPSGVHFTFGPAGDELVEGYSRSSRKGKREEEYFDGFESDHSNYPNSREASPVDSGGKRGGQPRVVKHRPPLPRSVPKVVTTLHGDDNNAETSFDRGGDGRGSGHQYVLHEPYGNVPVYPNEPEPAPQPLPKESFGMLRRYLEYFGHAAEGDISAETTGEGSFTQAGSSRGRQEEDWGYQSIAATSNTERHFNQNFSVSGNLKSCFCLHLVMSR